MTGRDACSSSSRGVHWKASRPSSGVAPCGGARRHSVRGHSNSARDSCGTGLPGATSGAVSSRQKCWSRSCLIRCRRSAHCCARSTTPTRTKSTSRCCVSSRKPRSFCAIERSPTSSRCSGSTSMSASSNRALSAWMAGHALGGHFEAKHTAPILLEAARTARFAAGRGAAVKGLGEHLDEAPPDLHEAIVRELRSRARTDRSESVKAAARNALNLAGIRRSTPRRR